MNRIARASLAATLLFSIAPTGAFAHDEVITDDGGTVVISENQHPGIEGHLPAGSENVKVVSKLALSNVVEGAVADVGYHKGFAYLTRFRGPNCFGAGGDAPGGVWIVDVRNPAKPKEIGYLPTSVGSYAGEGSHAIHIETASFVGDVLAINNENCVDGTLGGMNLWDVTDPYHPVALATHAGDKDALGVAQQIHSVFMWQGKDGKAYAVMTDDEEQADLDIMDISDPRAPTLLAEYDLDGVLAPQIVQPELGRGSTFLHDMVVKKIKGRHIMLVSYWDGGYVKLDVTDPTQPVYIADSDFANPDDMLHERTGASELPEGNAHQAEFNRDNEYIVAADEDFNPIRAEIRDNVTGAAIGASFGSDTPLPEVGVPIEGVSVFAGRGCTASGGDIVPPGNPAIADIAVVERGLCTFSEKVASVEAVGGYDAIMVFNSMASNRCEAGAGGMLVEGTTPTFGVTLRSAAFSLFNAVYDDAACLAGTQPFPVAPGTTGNNMLVRVYFDGWGYVRLFNNGSGKLVELDQYAIPEAHDVNYAAGFGDLSVHEIAMSIKEDELGYLSYYSGGVRVIEIEDDQINEVGHFIDEGGNNFWGVEVFKHKGDEYVLASDRDFGLYILRYTGGD